MKFKKLHKTLMKLLFVLTFALTCITFTSHKAFASVVRGFDFNPGDIMVTSSTSSNGILGHAGIVLPDGNTIAHIAGPNCNPDKISINDWLSNYPKTKVVRGCNLPLSMTPTGAAYYARNYFINGEGKHLSYGILGLNNTIDSKEEMYCSKLVWQCYSAAGLDYKTQVDMHIYSRPYKISPYSFINENELNYNGFKIVKTFNWN